MLNKLEEKLVIFFSKKYPKYGYIGHIDKSDLINELKANGMSAYSDDDILEALELLKNKGYILYEEFDESLPGIWDFKPNINQCHDYVDGLPTSKQTIINILYR